MNNDMNNQNVGENKEPASTTYEPQAPMGAPADFQPPADGADMPPVGMDMPPVVIMEMPPVDTPVEDQPLPGKALGIVSLVLAVIALVGGTILNCLCGLLGSIPFFIMAVVAVVLGIVATVKAKSVGKKNVFAIVGIIVGAVALVALVVGSIINAVVGALSALGNM